MIQFNLCRLFAITRAIKIIFNICSGVFPLISLNTANWFTVQQHSIVHSLHPKWQPSFVKTKLSHNTIMFYMFNFIFSDLLLFGFGFTVCFSIICKQNGGRMFSMWQPTHPSFQSKITLASLWLINVNIFMRKCVPAPHQIHSISRVPRKKILLFRPFSFSCYVSFSHSILVHDTGAVICKQYGA